MDRKFSAASYLMLNARKFKIHPEKFNSKSFFVGFTLGFH